MFPTRHPDPDVLSRQRTVGGRILSPLLAFSINSVYTFTMGLNISNFKRPLAVGVIFAFLTNVCVLPPAYAQLHLPPPGQMVPLSPAFSPAVLKGIQIDPKDPFRFHFFVDRGDEIPSVHDDALRRQSAKLIKYFLASLTIPEADLWVNLSPYEKDHIVPKEFGQTEMGRDLLAQDYLLKQVTASLIYPEGEIGKKFWDKVYRQAKTQYGTINIPINTFNKVWIVPDKAVVYEGEGPSASPRDDGQKSVVAFVLENHLKVMLEEDYLALNKRGQLNSTVPISSSVNALASQIVRSIIIPALTKEVNEGKNFAQLRQVFYSLILATWYKKKIKDSILAKVYADRKKVAGVGYTNSVMPERINRASSGLASPRFPIKAFGNDKAGDDTKDDVEAIYQRYLAAFKKGVFNYIKEEPDPLTNQTIPRKYFSGGVIGSALPWAIVYQTQIDRAQLASLDKSHLIDVLTDVGLKQDLAMSPADRAMNTFSVEFDGAEKVGRLTDLWESLRPAIQSIRQYSDKFDQKTRHTIRNLFVQDYTAFSFWLASVAQNGGMSEEDYRIGKQVMAQFIRRADLFSDFSRREELVTQGKNLVGNEMPSGVPKDTVMEWRMARDGLFTDEFAGVVKELKAALDLENLRSALNKGVTELGVNLGFGKNRDSARLSAPYKLLQSSGSTGQADRAMNGQEPGARTHDSENTTRPIESLPGILVDQTTGRIKLVGPEPIVKLNFILFAERHGETKANSENRLQGSGADDKVLNKLTPHGQEQAEAGANLLFNEPKIQDTIKRKESIVVITSELFRSKDTASPFVRLVEQAGGKVEYASEAIIKGADEINFGSGENKNEVDMVKTELALIQRYRNSLDATVKFEQGESFIDLSIRVYQWLQELNRLYAGRTVVLFGHGTHLSAVKILLGDQQMVDETGYINWRKNMFPNAKPVRLNDHAMAGKITRDSARLSAPYKPLQSSGSTGQADRAMNGQAPADGAMAATNFKAADFVNKGYFIYTVPDRPKQKFLFRLIRGKVSSHPKSYFPSGTSSNDIQSLEGIKVEIYDISSNNAVYVGRSCRLLVDMPGQRRYEVEAEYSFFKFSDQDSLDQKFLNSVKNVYSGNFKQALEDAAQDRLKQRIKYINGMPEALRVSEDYQNVGRLESGSLGYSGIGSSLTRINNAVGRLLKASDYVFESAAPVFFQKQGARIVIPAETAEDNPVMAFNLSSEGVSSIVINWRKQLSREEALDIARKRFLTHETSFARSLAGTHGYNMSIAQSTAVGFIDTWLNAVDDWMPGLSETLNIKQPVSSPTFKSNLKQIMQEIMTDDLAPFIALSGTNKYMGNGIRQNENALRLIRKWLKVFFIALPNAESMSDSRVLGSYVRQRLSEDSVQSSEKASADRAMNGQLSRKGGIDLNPAQMNMQSFGAAGHSSGLAQDSSDFNINPAQITGATFTIRQMTPVTNFPLILGIAESNQNINIADAASTYH